MPRAADLHVPSADVVVNGTRLGPEVMGNLLELRVKDNLALPATALVRIADPELKVTDGNKFPIGGALQIKLGEATNMGSATLVFDGEVMALEPEFADKGRCTLVVRALERTHKLHRKRQSRTFVQMTATDMVKKVISELGLTAGTIDATSVTHEYFHQAAETDWEFLNRLAIDNDREVVAQGRRVHFRKAGEGSGGPIQVKYGEDLLDFRPRLSGVQQIAEVEVRGWDVKSKRDITGAARNGQGAHAQIGKSLSSVMNDAGGGKLVIADRTVESVKDAQTLAESTVGRLADSFVEAEGSTFGAPEIRAGAKVEIAGVGTTFGGTYVVTSATHVFRGGTGYKTHFTISGRSPRTLLDLMRPPEPREDWGSSFVVGIVDNNNDPDQMGRIKVKFPALGANHLSTWARLVVPMAGAQRGLYAVPQPGEEVVVGFENGDARRPYVIGSVFNGKDKPPADLLQNKDGSFALMSAKKIWMKSTEDIEITSDKNMVVTISKDLTEKPGGNYTNEATGNTKVKAQQVNIEAGGTLSIKGVSVTVEASASLTLKGATVTVQGSGPTSIKGNPIAIG